MDANTQILGTVRASAWPELFDCAQRFYWKNVMGLRGPSSGKAWLGTAVHAGTAKFDQANLEGKPLLITDAVDASREKIAHPEEEVAWDDDLTERDADKFAVLLTTKYCGDIAPTQRYESVELKCTALDVTTKHGTLRLTGTTDRVRVLADGRKGIADLKTGERATEKTADGGRRAATRLHEMQLGVYTLMAEQASKQTLDAPALIVGMQTTKETPCAVGEVADVKTPLLGDENQTGLIEIAAQMMRAGLFPPNPKSMLCSKKYCPAYERHCKYRGQ